MPDAASVRRYVPGDEAEVLTLLQASLGWAPDQRTAALFAWKHWSNPFGPSPAWVALSDERIVGFRAFLRWEFRRQEATVRAVRAVDTATHPDYRGRGVFTRLTRHALDELADDGVAFVFNTPNQRSLPGYLKMGWRILGRLPLLVRLHSLTSIPRLASAQAPADKWSVPTTVGLPAHEVLNSPELASLFGTAASPPSLHTSRTLAFLQWRYGGPSLSYRVMFVSRDPAEGLAVFRLRRRGRAIEATLCDFAVPDDNDKVKAQIAKQVVTGAKADYGVLIGRMRLSLPGLFSLPRKGPVLAWRPLMHMEEPNLRQWALHLGDVESL